LGLYTSKKDFTPFLADINLPYLYVPVRMNKLINEINFPIHKESIYKSYFFPCSLVGIDLYFAVSELRTPLNSQDSINTSPTHI
jgi:hypothetical protein